MSTWAATKLVTEGREEEREEGEGREKRVDLLGLK
jgi:hypothetical protein